MWFNSKICIPPELGFQGKSEKQIWMELSLLLSKFPNITVMIQVIKQN
jgi:hypothetical protein